jgi:hypothetical protein
MGSQFNESSFGFSIAVCSTHPHDADANILYLYTFILQNALPASP